MSAQVLSLQKQLVQLREEATIQRIPVSQAIAELLSYMTQLGDQDILVIGINQAENPFRDQPKCAIL